MRGFFEKNKIFFGIIIAGLVIGAAVYISFRGPTKETAGSQKEVSLPECQNIPSLPDGVLKLATKIIDGDTFLIEGGYSVRILGIDADERGRACYKAAKNRLEELILNKEVKLEKGREDTDQWCRYLRYVFLNGENISLILAKEGLAVARFSPEDIKCREKIAAAEKAARENKIGCKWNKKQAEEEEKDTKVSFQWEKLIPGRTSLKIVGACQAGNYIGQERIVEGKIVDTYRSKTNTVFLNFEKPYPNPCFTGVIFSSDQYKFVEEPEKYYLGKTCKIKGRIKQYKGRPEIILKDPSQVETGK